MGPRRWTFFSSLLQRTALPCETVTPLGRAFADAARQRGVSTAGIANAVARAEQP